MKKSLFALIIFVLKVSTAGAETSDAQRCLNDMGFIKGSMKAAEVSALCQKMVSLTDCKSVEGLSIYHYDRPGSSAQGRKILAMSLIHGDEQPSVNVTRSWIQRLEKIDPRNSWRVIPVVNPDGLRSRKRTNANGVDLNRNFPTKEWAQSALESWRLKTKSDPRRFPGNSAASEAEVKCLMKHLEEFKPDFIISIHTPIGVLDFDGPSVQAPRGSPLPWSSLGNFPGSLGRYMWKDNNVPVLTIELKGNAGVARLEEFDHLQDISGSLAIETTRSVEGAKN